MIQGSASESALVALLASKSRKLREIGDQTTDQKLVAYFSKQAHSCIERAALLGHMTTRVLDTDDAYSMRGHTLQECIERDKARGLIPCYVGASFGTTSVCSFDNIKELGMYFLTIVLVIFEEHFYYLSQ